MKLTYDIERSKGKGEAIKYVNYDIVFQEFPDEVTLAINLSRCPNHCKGCHSPYLMKDVGEELTQERLFILLNKYVGSITCVGLMGGDNNPIQVMSLFSAVRQHYPQLKTGWYSGKTDFPKGFQPEVFDYVKIGPYKEEFGPLNAPTTNQHLYKMTDGEMIDITSVFWKKHKI